MMDPSGRCNFENSCRTCLDAISNNNMHNIFTGLCDTLNIVDIINKNTTLDINRGDELPKNLCSKCYNCIKAFYDFCELAKAVDCTLKKQIKNGTHTDTSKFLDHQENNNSLDDIKMEDDIEDEESDDILNTDIKQEYCHQNEHEPLNANNNIENIQISLGSKPLSKCKHKCEICSKKFRNLTNLSEHKKKHNGKIKYYTCDICLKLYINHDKFLKHLDMHQIHMDLEESSTKKLESTEQTCQVCSLMFQSKNALSAHMKKHAKKGRVLSCTICGKVFAKISHLKRHEMSHEVNHPFKCSLCQKTFGLENSWKEHMNKHNGIKPHPCPMCPKSFSHLTTLTTHIKIHIKEKPYLCPTCGKRFDSSTNLNQHMRRHLGLKVFACTLCPKKFVSKGELKSHNITHTGERSFACDQCGATFTKRTSLAKHTMRHTGIKPYQCDTCPMKFTCKDHLKRHYRIHTGEKPYKCDMCERAFTQSNDLVKHRRAHLGDNLYKCSQCTQSFRLKTELRQHISEHFISQQLEALNVENKADMRGHDVPLDAPINGLREVAADIKKKLNPY